ncbi:hypothetical protein [Gordonia aquimaris]|uniref:Uncharacterized protein n=1 Tax=Gordonia aquimaris TaxID=2984863 RepID=A0A9X3I4E2_9ACTN|nr:hypothetical protein [Gordonia aquimaris]MCX2964618.1 hypothetical protein [Gordonia aquimaris]
MTNMGGNGIRRSQKVERRRNRKQKRHGVTAGVAALATVAAVGVGQMVVPAQAQADIFDDIDLIESINLNPAASLGEVIGTIVNNPASQTALDQWRIQGCASGGVSGGADCQESTGTGIAIVLPGELELAPRVVFVPIQSAVNDPFVQSLLEFLGIENATIDDALEPEGSATVIGSGFQFAMASTGGNATAVSYLPLSLATAGASDGRTAYAFAIVGMANAWTTDDIPVTILGLDTGVDIPGIQQVSCYGGLTGAYAEEVGACANVLGTFDFRWSQPNGEVQFALTDPSAVLTDPSGVFSQVITQLLNGEPFTLSKDFARLSFAGDYDLLSGNFVRFTSDYGTQESTTINWLGQQLTLNPMVTVNGQERPNHLGVPILTLGELDTGEIVPVLHITDIEFPFGIPSAGPFVIPDTSSSMTSTATLAVSETEAPDVEPTMQQIAALSEPAQVEPESAADETEEYVGKHRIADVTPEYVGKHRADDASDTIADSATAGAPTESAEPGDGAADDTDSAEADASDTDPADTDPADTGSADSTDDTESDADSDSGDNSADGGDAGSSSVDEG